jgi:ribosome-interacting GTPase 1
MQATSDLISTTQRTGSIRPENTLSPAPQEHYHKAIPVSSLKMQNLRSLKQNIYNRMNSIRFTNKGIEPHARLVDAEIYQDCVKESVREIKRRSTLVTATQNDSGDRINSNFNSGR